MPSKRPVDVTASRPTNGNRRHEPSAKLLAATRRLGLRYVAADTLSIRRRRCGRGWIYVAADKRVIRDPKTARRLSGLAMPPAYQDVLYASDPAAHLQAVGRDAAGRLQYRYHPKWEHVRELDKARRLARLAAALPRIRRSIAQHLRAPEPTRELASAAVIEMVALSAIRSGRESYARQRGTRGAATLLKSNVALRGRTIALTFASKGGKTAAKEFSAPRLARAIALLRRLPGRRLFQYRAADGKICRVTAREVNAFLREIAGAGVSLKDFRTMLASASALAALARTAPAAREGARRRQVLSAVRAVAEDLGNTPAVCRRSYVHQAVVVAFQDGALAGLSQALNGRSATRRARALASVVAKAAR